MESQPHRRVGMVDMSADFFSKLFNFFFYTGGTAFDKQRHLSHFNLAFFRECLKRIKHSVTGRRRFKHFGAHPSGGVAPKPSGTGHGCCYRFYCIVAQSYHIKLRVTAHTVQAIHSLRAGKNIGKTAGICNRAAIDLPHMQPRFFQRGCKSARHISRAEYNTAAARYLAHSSAFQVPM